jgi:tetratricopeptide (TPR) repeat protein
LRNKTTSWRFDCYATLGLCTLTAEEFVKKAEDQRRRGRVVEARISAKQATCLDPKNANAFWQLALCDLDLESYAEALASLETVTELAPWFAFGWTRLGQTLQSAGKGARARMCFERAIKEKSDEPEALRELAAIYGDCKQADDERRVLLALDQVAELTLNQLNRLGILQQQAKEFFSAIHYFRRVAAEGSGGAGFFNLGLIFNSPEVHQRADALDAWRRTLDREPEHKQAPKMIAGLLPRLTLLKETVLSSSAKRFNLDQTLLDPDQWFTRYICPFELLGLDEDIEPWDLDAKLIQRAKKTLLQEIDLEDNRVKWMPGLHIDRSRALSVCDELRDPYKQNYHHQIFQDGRLRHFYSAATYVTSLSMNKIRGSGQLNYSRKIPMGSGPGLVPNLVPNSILC